MKLGTQLRFRPGSAIGTGTGHRVPMVCVDRSPVACLAVILFGLWLWPWVMWGGEQTVEPPAKPSVFKLAILNPDSQLSTAADLLTAELSHDERVKLLERDQIHKVLAEQARSAGNGKDFLRLGEILGADGVLILELVEMGDRRLLSARLVAIKPGVTMDHAEYDFPLAEPEPWSKLVAGRFAPLFPKLGVLKQDAVPISILNLRSAVASAEGENLEHQLTLLLYDRLMSERVIFVLERRHLEMLAAEKELDSSETSPFWNGSLLIEGVIDPHGFKSNVVTIVVQITPPGGQGVNSVEVFGARNHLAGTVNDLALRIVAAARKETTATNWNASAEAGRYLAEAQWMLKWQMFQEAKSACEAAWALGSQTREVAELRVRAYTGCAGDPGICVVSGNQVIFGRQMRRRVFDYMEIGAFASPPDAGKFSDMVRATELLAEGCRTFSDQKKPPDAAWLNLAVQTLDSCSMWLRYYYFNVETRIGQEEKIARAKELCRDIVRVISSNSNSAAAGSDVFVSLKARNMALWTEEPGATLRGYHEMLDAGQWPQTRTRFFNFAFQEISVSRREQGFVSTLVTPALTNADVSNPCLTGWNWETRQRCPELWNRFIDELCVSPKPLMCLEGLVLRCSYSWSDVDFEMNLTRLLDYAAQHFETIAEAGLYEGLVSDLELIIDHRANTLTDSRKTRVKDALWSNFRRKIEALSQQYVQPGGTPKDRQAHQVEMRERSEYLQTQTNFDFSSFVRVLPNKTYTATEAIELLPLLTNYAARIKSAVLPSGSDRMSVMRAQMAQQQSDFWVGNLQKALKNAISPPPPDLHAPGPAAPKTAAQPAGNPPVEAVLPPKNPATPSTIKTARFWKIPTSNEGPYLNPLQSPRITSCCYRDGRLWMEIRHDETGSGGRADFLGLNLETGAFQKAQYLGAQLTLQNTMAIGHRQFDVFDQYLYLSFGDYVRRYSFKERAWEPFPAAGSGKPVRLGNRLFFTSTNSILEYKADASMEVLASSRRRPALTALDKVDDYSPCHLFLNEKGSVQVLAGNEVYALLPASNEWRSLGTLPTSGSPEDSGISEEGFMVPTWSASQAWWGMGSSSTGPELWFEYVSNMGLRTPGSSRPSDPNTPAPLWRGRLPGRDFSLSKDCLWFAVAPGNRPNAARGSIAVGEGAPQDAVLKCYKFGETRPITIPLRLGISDQQIPFLAADGMTKIVHNSAPWDRWILQFVPKGLVLTLSGLPGFWLIPKADLDQAVAEVESQHRTAEAAMQAQREAWPKELLTAYDLNHDGLFEANEAEAMVDDQRYLELGLLRIDANGNGLLEADELRAFDVNHNGLLDPAEQRAIEKTFSLLADRLMEPLEQDQYGKVSLSDLPVILLQSMSSEPMTHSLSSVNERIGHTELVDRLRTHLGDSLGQKLRAAAPNPRPIVPGSYGLNPQTQFKERVEAFWRNSTSATATRSEPANPSPPPLLEKP